jgi:lactate dehydrogenase-like 2-hydroxyacid dehydrogenase
MKPKILVTREVFDEALDYLDQYFEVQSNQPDLPMTPERLAAALADKAGVMTTISDKVDEALLSKCPQLKAVCNIAVGFNNIDLAACTAHGVMATNTPGVLDAATADFTWALILATARRVTESEAWLRRGEWQGWKLKQFLGADVHGATLGIIGMGRIGQAVARRALGFDMKVIYHNRHRLGADIEARCQASHAGMDELLQQADIVTLHVPYSQATHHLIGEKELVQMKPTAILINAARGGVVDDAVLAAALKARRIAAAGLDVFEGEPALNAGLLELDNVVLTPHIASASESTRRAMAMLAARNLVAALTTGNPPNLLNKS